MEPWESALSAGQVCTYSFVFMLVLLAVGIVVFNKVQRYSWTLFKKYFAMSGESI